MKEQQPEAEGLIGSDAFDELLDQARVLGDAAVEEQAEPLLIEDVMNFRHVF